LRIYGNNHKKPKQKYGYKRRIGELMKNMEGNTAGAPFLRC